MVAILFVPGNPPQAVEEEGLKLPNPVSGYAYVTDRTAELLGCAKELVDVYDCGPGYAAYTIFDYEGEDVNNLAAEALTKYSLHTFLPEDEELRGPLLLIVR